MPITTAILLRLSAVLIAFYQLVGLVVQFISVLWVQAITSSIEHSSSTQTTKVFILQVAIVAVWLMGARLLYRNADDWAAMIERVSADA